MDIEKITSAVQSVLDKIKTPAEVLPPALIWCTAINRPGGSPQKTASQIIQMLGGCGIPTGKNTDGSENMINQFVYAMTKGVYDMVSKDMVVDMATPVGGIMVQATGGNAGGPVVCTGFNLNNVLSRGFSH